MINLNDPRDQTPNAIGITGVVLLVGAGIVFGFIKPENPDSIKKKHNAALRKLEEREETATKEKVQSAALVERYRWNSKIDDVAPAALDTITKLAKQNNLTLVSFRPQKPIDSAALTQLPFQMIVDGSFVNVANLIQSIERTDSKLAIQQVQYAGQEGETDIVTANINLIAFIKKPEATKPAPSTKPASTTVPGAKNNG